MAHGLRLCHAFNMFLTSSWPVVVLCVAVVPRTTLGFQRTTTPMIQTRRQHQRPMAIQEEPPSSQTLLSSRNESNIFHSLSMNENVPKLIVFDLDNTLWTPELYMLRNRKITRPVADTHIQLFPGAQEILQQIRDYQHFAHQNEQFTTNKIRFAIASRTTSIDWALDLLHQYQIHDLFHYIEIFPADKKQHFRNLHEASRIPYHEMIFFDDARDGKFGNCVSVAELGVVSVHCPFGLSTSNICRHALLQYQTMSMNNNGIIPKHTIIERDGTITD